MVIIVIVKRVGGTALSLLFTELSSLSWMFLSISFYLYYFFVFFITSWLPGIVWVYSFVFYETVNEM